MDGLKGVRRSYRMKWLAEIPTHYSYIAEHSIYKSSSSGLLLKSKIYRGRGSFPNLSKVKI